MVTARTVQPVGPRITLPRVALIELGQCDLIGGCTRLIPANPPKEALEKATAGGPVGGRGRSLPHHRQPGQGRVARRARDGTTKARLPAGTEDSVETAGEDEKEIRRLISCGKAKCPARSEATNPTVIM